MGFFAFSSLFELGAVWGCFGGSVDQLLITFDGPLTLVTVGRAWAHSVVCEFFV